MSERPLTYDHLRSQKKPVTKSVWIALDSEVADGHADAEREWEVAQERVKLRPEDETLKQQLADALEKYEAAKAALRESSVKFSFRSIGRRAYEDLVQEHPPTPDQREYSKKLGAGDPSWNTDTFPIALIAASLVEPQLSVEDVKDIWDSDEWSGAETMSLFATALDVNSNRRLVDLGKG